MEGKFYFASNDASNLILINAGERWFMTEGDNRTCKWAGVDLYEETDDYKTMIERFTPTIEKLKAALKKGEEDGSFDFSRWYFEQIDEITEWRGLDNSEIEYETVFIGTAVVELPNEIIYSVEIKQNSYNDDLFNGTYQQCVDYINKNNYTREENDARIAKIELDEKGCVIECLDIIEAEEF